MATRELLENGHRRVGPYFRQDVQSSYDMQAPGIQEGVGRIRRALFGGSDCRRRFHAKQRLYDGKRADDPEPGADCNICSERPRWR